MSSGAQFDTTLEDAPGESAVGPSLEAYLFLVLESARPLAGGLRIALRGVDEVAIGRGAPRAVERIDEPGKTTVTVRVPDPRMSSSHARIVRGLEGWRLVDSGSTNGSWVEGQRTSSAALDDGALVELGSSLFTLRTDLATHGAPTDVDSTLARRRVPGLLSLLPEIEDELGALVRVAPSGVPVLLLGESGTGKEVLARAVHAMSLRSGPFVPVNCGALPPTLVESQLFGHVRGAFSGADRDEPGLVRASDRGTLFLDEIGDLLPSSQAALLRVLQEREVLPVGSTRAIKVDLRVVAATHRRVDLLAEGFRPDLYARISGYQHGLSPLRDRREDLGVLVSDLLPAIAADRAADVRLSPELGRALFHHPFPLNVRELHSALSVGLVLAEGGVIELRHVPEPIRTAPAPAAPAARPSGAARPRARTEEDERVRGELVAALQAHDGNVSGVARAMGRTRMQIHRWMKRFGVDPETYRR